MMTDGEIYPFMIVFGLFSALALIVVAPLWIYSEFVSLRRSIRYLREDLETQDLELKQLRETLVTLRHTEPTDSWDM